LPDANDLFGIYLDANYYVAFDLDADYCPMLIMYLAFDLDADHYSAFI